MKILSIVDAENLASRILLKLQFPENEIKYIVSNLIEAELAERKSHGLNKLLIIKRVLQNKFDKDQKYFDFISLDKDVDLEVLSESENHLYIDAHYKTGFYAIGKTLEDAIPRAKKTSIFAVGLKDVGFATGFIGAYARKASLEGLVYLGFHNSSGGLHYFGTKDDPLGTNPITISFPSEPFQTIADVSMAAMNWNDVEVARRNGEDIPLGKVIDKEGNDTTDPSNIFAVKSIAGHKGTALAYAVELLAGALTGSRVGFSQHGGWGSFFILINPNSFVGENVLEESVISSNQCIKTLKSNSEPIIPGEQSAIAIKNNTSHGTIGLSDELYTNLVRLQEELEITPI